MYNINKLYVYKIEARGPWPSFASHHTSLNVRVASTDLPLAPAGSQHQKKVWAEICAIPFGGYRTYGDLASEIGSSARAVGTACGKNPIPIIVPCHRILGSNGRIGGYSGRGGTTTKHRLLRHEGVRTKYRASPHLEAPGPAR